MTIIRLLLCCLLPALAVAGPPIKSPTLSGTVTINSGSSLILTGVTVTGFTVGAGSVTSSSILDGTIVNADISVSAAISYSKLALTGAIVNADIVSLAASKLTGALPAIDGSALTGVTATIADGSITNAKLANSSVTIGSTALSLGATATTLTGLSSVTSTSFVGALTGNVTGNVSGTAATVTGATQAAITSAANLATVGTVTTGTWSGLFGAVSGVNLTSLNASNLASGTVPPARLGSGSGGSTKFLREDSTFQTIAGGGGSSGYTVKTANYTAVAGDRLFVNDAGAPVVITLPAAPTAGDSVEVFSRIGDTTVAAAAGFTGTSTAVKIASDQSKIFVYDGAGSQWRVAGELAQEAGATVYVETWGSDSFYRGGSASTPFKTLQAAFDYSAGQSAIHVGAGTFAGISQTGAIAVDILGQGSGRTIITLIKSLDFGAITVNDLGTHTFTATTIGAVPSAAAAETNGTNGNSIFLRNVAATTVNLQGGAGGASAGTAAGGNGGASGQLVARGCTISTVNISAGNGGAGDATFASGGGGSYNGATIESGCVIGTINGNGAEPGADNGGGAGAAGNGVSVSCKLSTITALNLDAGTAAAAGPLDGWHCQIGTVSMAVPGAAVEATISGAFVGVSTISAGSPTITATVSYINGTAY